MNLDMDPAVCLQRVTDQWSPRLYLDPPFQEGKNLRIEIVSISQPQIYYYLTFTTVLCEKIKILVGVCYSPKQNTSIRWIQSQKQEAAL